MIVRRKRVVRGVFPSTPFKTSTGEKPSCISPTHSETIKTLWACSGVLTIARITLHIAEKPLASHTDNTGKGRSEPTASDNDTMSVSVEVDDLDLDFVFPVVDVVAVESVFVRSEVLCDEIEVLFVLSSLREDSKRQDS